MEKSYRNFWLHMLAGAAGGIAVLICLHLLMPSPRPLGRLVRFFSLPILRLFDGIVALSWPDNPDQGMVLYPLLYLGLLAYWALIGMAVSWLIYWHRGRTRRKIVAANTKQPDG